MNAGFLAVKLWFQYNQLITQLKRISVATAKNIDRSRSNRTDRISVIFRLVLNVVLHPTGVYGYSTESKGLFVIDLLESMAIALNPKCCL
jgi:hypothetical protein